MNKKQLVDLITAIVLIISGGVVMVFPLMSIDDIKYILITILAFYTIINLLQFIHTYKDKDHEGLFTSIASIIAIIVSYKMDITGTPSNLAIALFIWVIFMSLIKLKKCDYYHDRNSKVWKIRVVTLLLFIVTGVLTTINFYYTADVQVLVLGFFFYIHGILELIDPLSVYLYEKND